METGYRDTFAQDHLPDRSAWPDILLDLPGLQYPDRLNAAVELLDGQLDKFGERPCVQLEDGVWTYRDLAERSSQIANVLVDVMGLEPGNRVLLRGPNNPELIACWFGVLKAGGIVVATMPLLRSSELVKVIEKAEISHALVDSRFTEELEKSSYDAPCLSDMLSFGPGGELEALAAGKPKWFDPIDTAAEDIALIAFTSGTTGSPKGCMHSHRDILAVCDTYARHILKPSPEDVFTGTPPIAFTFGLGGLVLFPLRFGASTLPLEKVPPDELPAVLERFGVTTLFTAPTAYRAMLRKSDFVKPKALHTCVSAGEALPAATFEQWRERTGLTLLDGIGSTEMLHIFIAAPREKVRAGSTGLAVPGYEARVVDDEMRDVAPGEIGRLAVRGPTGCRYLADDRQSEYVIGGWNVTGDSYVLDEDGYFWFQARADDMIVSSGYNISGPEVEAALLRHEAVAECAVVASPDEERGAVVKAFVVAAPGREVGDGLVAELQNFVKGEIAPYKYPRRIEFIGQLPKTQTGKVQRFRLREMEQKKLSASSR